MLWTVKGYRLLARLPFLRAAHKRKAINFQKNQLTLLCFRAIIFERQAGVSFDAEIHADMAELADALDSGSSEGNFMQVQFLLSAPKRKRVVLRLFFLFRLCKWF